VPDVDIGVDIGGSSYESSPQCSRTQVPRYLPIQVPARLVAEPLNLGLSVVLCCLHFPVHLSKRSFQTAEATGAGISERDLLPRCRELLTHTHDG
jgi:hypothetical protein